MNEGLLVDNTNFYEVQLPLHKPSASLMDDTRSDIGIYNSLTRQKPCSDMINEHVQCSRFLIKRKAKSKSNDSDRRFSSISSSSNLSTSSSSNNFSSVCISIDKSPSNSIDSISSGSSFSLNIKQDGLTSDNLNSEDQINTLKVEKQSEKDDLSVFDDTSERSINNDTGNKNLSDGPLKLDEELLEPAFEKLSCGSMGDKLQKNSNDKDIVNEAFKFLDDI